MLTGGLVATLARRLARLSTKQIRDAFEGADFTDYPEASASGGDVDEWARAFRDKVRQITARQITARKPCPTP